MKVATHLYDHELDFNSPYTLPINESRRVKIYWDMVNHRYIYAPQYRNLPDKKWHNYITNRKAWASFTMDGALAKLGIRPTGLWRVYIFDAANPGTYADKLSKRKPTRWAREVADSLHYEIIPLS